MSLIFPHSLFLLRSSPHTIRPTIIPHSLTFCSQSSTNDKKTPTLSISAVSKSSSSETKITDFDAVVEELDSDFEDLKASPWEGAVVFRREASVSHVEYWTTLERLGLAKISSGLSRSRASEMGIRLTARMIKDSPLADQTPVLISIDVSRRKRRLKLDGILRTVISLRCNRCAEPASESVFSNFSLLLMEDSIKEKHDEINMGVLYGVENVKSTAGINSDEMEDDEKLIDEDDKLHFPSDEEEIDLSKHIRDLVHVEITISAICSADCKGLCLKCGTNLNKNSCKCNQKAGDAVQYGPLGNLRKQMQQS